MASPPAFVVTIAYWALLASSATFATPYRGTIDLLVVCVRPLTRPPPLAWDNVSVHILNSVFALFEILLTFLGPVSWLYLPLCISIIGLYIGLAYVTHASQNFYRPFPYLYPALVSSVLILLSHVKLTSSSTRISTVGRLRAMCSVFLSENALSSPSYGGSLNSGTESSPNVAPRFLTTLPIRRRTKQARFDQPNSLPYFFYRFGFLVAISCSYSDSFQ